MEATATQTLQIWWAGLGGRTGLALVGVYVANLLMVTAICFLALARSHRRHRKLKSLQVLTKGRLRSELFSAIKVRAQAEYLLIPFAALFFFFVTSALATLLGLLLQHAKPGDTIQEVTLVAILPAYGLASVKVYAAMEGGQLRSATFLRATVDICFASIVVICAWILIGQRASASGGRVVLGAVLVIAVFWLNRNWIRRWAQRSLNSFASLFRRRHPVKSEGFDSSPNTLQRIEGLSAANIAELNQLGIETVEHLAKSDPVLLFQQTSLEVMQVIDCIGQAQLRTRFLSMGRDGMERRLRYSGIRTVLDFAAVMRLPNPPGMWESDDDAIAASSWEELQYVATLLEKDSTFKAIAELSTAVSEPSADLADAFPEGARVSQRDHEERASGGESRHQQCISNESASHATT